MPSKREVLGDFYYRQAKREGFRSRSALKLREISESHHVIKRGERVADLGAAPGGWLQIERELVGAEGLIVGVDLSFIKPLPYDNVKIIRGDITEPSVLDALLNAGGRPFDVLVSDLAPKFSGIHDLDHARQIDLARAALQSAQKVLRRGGSMIVKVLMGSEFISFKGELERSFSSVKIFKPRASREHSTETYLICKGFIGGEGDDARPSHSS